MLVFDFVMVGNKLHGVRKLRGMTQAEVAEAAGLSDRTYADIERGSVNMRVETLLKICCALNITPDEVLTDENHTEISEAHLAEMIACCSEKEKRTLLKLLDTYVESLNH